MVAGTGTTTADCKLSQVCHILELSLPAHINTYIIFTVLYRSKDGALPDFSQETGPGGEVFFDVSILHATSKY